jgi:hypothetical protein
MKVSFYGRPHPGPLLRGEGEIFAASLEIQTAGLAGRSAEKPKSAQGDFLSPGERIKGEGERKTQIQFPHSFPPSALEKSRVGFRRERELHWESLTGFTRFPRSPHRPGGRFVIHKPG